MYVTPMQFIESRIKEPVARVVARTGLKPNHLTYSGSALVVGASLLLIGTRSILLTIGIFVLGFVLDMLDGPLARLTNTVSVYGAWLDTFCDRVNEISLSIAITIVYIVHFEWVDQQVVALSAFGLGYLVSFSKAFAEEKGIQVDWKDRWILGYPLRVAILLGGMILSLVLPFSNTTVLAFTMLALFAYNYLTLGFRIKKIHAAAH